MDELTDWLKSLTTPQLRALASQAGITEWATRDRDSLLHMCRQRSQVVDIYEEHFGS
jgi:hypothetical protein